MDKTFFDDQVASSALVGIQLNDPMYLIKFNGPHDPLGKSPLQQPYQIPLPPPPKPAGELVNSPPHHHQRHHNHHHHHHHQHEHRHHRHGHKAHPFPSPLSFLRPIIRDGNGNFTSRAYQVNADPSDNVLPTYPISDDPDLQNYIAINFEIRAVAVPSPNLNIWQIDIVIPVGDDAPSLLYSLDDASIAGPSDGLFEATIAPDAIPEGTQMTATITLQPKTGLIPLTKDLNVSFTVSQLVLSEVPGPVQCEVYERYKELDKVPGGTVFRDRGTGRTTIFLVKHLVEQDGG
jgi:hypothetical protein